MTNPPPSNNLDRAIAQATQLVAIDNEAALLNILAALRIVSEELDYLARRAH